MAEDSLFEYLHGELVSYAFGPADVDDSSSHLVEKCITKLERIGFDVGYRLTERLTRDSPRFKDELETVKYICKDFWLSVQRKQIDNLRTNHQGVYVLVDNRFRLLVKMSSANQFMEVSGRYLAYTCGLVRGALFALGLQCVVTADVAHMPACKFNIIMQRG